jgi:hypothetical protein
MKQLALACAAALAAFGGAALAGNSPAGPAGGSAVVGSTVLPSPAATLKVPEKDQDGKRLAPGDGAALMLSGEQLQNVRNQLTAAEGVTMEGSVIRVPTQLNDGPATITLDTQSGLLMIVRN